MVPGRTDRFFIQALLAAALAPRLVWLWLNADGTNFGDSLWYHDAAVSIAAGHGYVNLFDGAPTAFWPVGYPALLAAVYAVFGSTMMVGKVLNIVLSMIAIVYAYRSFVLLFGDGWTSRLAAIVFALYPNFIFYSTALLSEIPTMCFLAVGTYYLLAGRPILSGLAFGLCVLVRPQYILLPGLFFLAQAMLDRAWRPTLKAALLAHLALVAVVAPWTLRNYMQLGAPVLVSSNGCFNFYLGNNPEQQWGASYPGPYALSFYDQTRGIPDELANARGLCRDAREFIATHPLRVLHLAYYKLYRFLRSDPRGLDTNVERARRVGQDLHPVAAALHPWANAYHDAVLIPALLLPVVWLLRRDSAGAILFTPVAVGAGLAVIFFGEGRFHIPILMFLVGAAAYTLSGLFTLARSRNFPSRSTV